MKRTNKQATLEKWLSDGKRITTMGGAQLWKNYDLRKCLSRVRKHFDLDEAWVTEKNGSRHKVWWLAK